MGPGLKTIIIAEDRLASQGREAAARINGAIICEFPDSFGQVQREREEAYHFFAHEVFHHWVGGYSVSHGEAIEGLTQYMADRTLARLGMVDSDKPMRDRHRRQQHVDTGVATEETRYYVRFDDLEKREGEATLCRLCQELAGCFRQAESANDKADVAPSLIAISEGISESP